MLVHWGATINLVRKKPTSEFQGHATLGAGSWDNYRSELDVSGPLTETGNRIAMDQTLQREVDMARRHLNPLSLLMLDIDHFKIINDTYGHTAGDKVLRAVAGAIKRQLRNVDMVFRFGGEEFLILLSNTGRDAAAMVGERLRQAAQAQDYWADDTRIELTVSLGCSTLLAAESTESLLRRADSALYVAKREGRNRLAMAG